MTEECFRLLIRKKKVIEVYNFISRRVKTRMSQRKNDIVERRLKGSDGIGSQASFEDLKRKHEGKPTLVRIFEVNRLIFQTKLPKGLPPIQSVDHRVKIINGTKPSCRRLHRISPSKLLEAKDYIM